MAKKNYLVILGTIITVLFFLKCLITTDITPIDETFYIESAFRLYQGDAFMIDELTPVSLNGILLLPFVWLYMFFMKSTDGIIIYFRVLYLLFKLGVLVFCIKKLKKYHLFGIIGISIFYFFSPYNIDALSYNTIPLGLILMIGAVLLTEKRSFRDYYLCGILLAIAIVSQPFLIFLYFAGAIVAIYINYCNRKQSTFESRTNSPIKNYLVVTAGAFTVLVVIMCFMFSRSTPQEIIDNLPYFLSEGGGGSHSIDSIRNIAKIFYRPIKTIYYGIWVDYPIIFIINTIYLFVLIYIRCIRKRESEYLFYGSLACLILSCILILAKNRLVGGFVENIFFVPFLWFALEEIILIKHSKNKIDFILLYAASVIYVCCACFATDTGINSTSAAMCIMAVFSIILIPEMLKEQNGDFGKKYSLAACFVIAICVLTLRLVITWTNTVFTGSYTNYIAKGPLKGTWADEDTFNMYNNMISDLDAIEYSEQDTLLLIGNNSPIPYLYSEMKCGSYCSIVLNIQYDFLQIYYDMHPDKFPTVVYFYPLGDIESTYNDSNHWLNQYINSRKYDIYWNDGRCLIYHMDSD